MGEKSKRDRWKLINRKDRETQGEEETEQRGKRQSKEERHRVVKIAGKKKLREGETEGVTDGKTWKMRWREKDKRKDT